MRYNNAKYLDIEKADQSEISGILGSQAFRTSG